jgi:hypothetical protein
MKRIVNLLFVALFLALLAPALSAQYTNSYGYTFNNPVSASANAIFWSKMNARLTYRMMLKKRGYTDEQLGKMSTEQMEAILGGAAAAPEAKKAISGAPSKFRMAASYLCLPDLVKSLTDNQEYQKALLEVFIQGIQGYEKEAAPDGFDHDVAGAMTFFIAAAYYVYRDGEEPNGDGTTFIGRAIQEALDTPEFRQVTDADKQKFYEFMIGMGTYLIVAYKQAATAEDIKTAGQLKSSAADVLKAYLKLDPMTVRITAKGLEVAEKQP